MLTQAKELKHHGLRIGEKFSPLHLSKNLPPLTERTSSLRSEDQVYGEYCLEDDIDKKDALLQELISLLSKHAYAVVWLVLQESRPDIVNEALEAVLRQMPRFKGRSKFSTWTEAIIRNICRRKLRYHIRHKTDCSLDDTNAFVTSEDKINTRLDIHRIRGTLSEEERILFDAQLEGATYREIQQRLNLDSENAARLRWHRLKSKIAKEMGSAGTYGSNSSSH